jgi:hypothetical protein
MSHFDDNSVKKKENKIEQEPKIEEKESKKIDTQVEYSEKILQQTEELNMQYFSYSTRLFLKKYSHNEHDIEEILTQ